MKIKHQELIMSAVKNFLDAQDAQAAYKPPVYLKRKRSAATLAKQRAAVLEAKSALTNAIDSANAELRKVYVEVQADRVG